MATDLRASASLFLQVCVQKGRQLLIEFITSIEAMSVLKRN